MPEDPMFREAEFLKEVAPLPVLSSGLRSRVLAAALEAQDRRSQGRRVLASALGMFAMLVGVAWMGPFSTTPFSTRPDSNGSFSASDVQASAASSASSAVSSLQRGQGLMSVMGDDWQPVEAQLQSRQEHFSRFQM